MDQTEHNLAHWEKQIDALLTLLSDEKRGLIRVYELRRGIETLGPESYEKLGYYERWIESIRMILVERGVVSEAEITQKIAAMRQATP